MSAPAIEPTVDEQLAGALGLAADEYGKICELLGRTPTYTELGITSALWSEHCSYKSSKVYLQELPTKGEQVLQGPGRERRHRRHRQRLGGGVQDRERTTTPVVLEPYQGAATGVGGILRDIFTMGARPIACLDSLRFGPTSTRRACAAPDRRRGSAALATTATVSASRPLGGETGLRCRLQRQHPGQRLRPRRGPPRAGLQRRGRRRGQPDALRRQPSTGRDGIHGATMASESFGERLVSPNARRSRWATRSPRSSCSKPASRR